MRKFSLFFLALIFCLPCVAQVSSVSPANYPVQVVTITPTSCSMGRIYIDVVHNAAWFGNRLAVCNLIGNGAGIVNWYVNNAKVGSEPGGDFDDATNTAWAGTDDPTHSLVHLHVNASGGGTTCGSSSGLIPPGYICAGPPALSALGPPILDDGFGYAFGPTTVTATLQQPIAAGQQILVAIACSVYPLSGAPCGGSSTASNFTDSMGNTYELIGPSVSAGYWSTQFAIATLAAASTAPVTVTFSNAATTSPYGLAVFKTYNIGSYDSQGQQSTVSGTTTATAPITTVTAGNLNIGIAFNTSGSTVPVLSQNSTNWVDFGTSGTAISGWYFGWSGTFQALAGANSLTWSSTAVTGPASGQAVAIVAFSPAGAWTADGPPSFRPLYQSDMPNPLFANGLIFGPTNLLMSTTAPTSGQCLANSSGVIAGVACSGGGSGTVTSVGLTLPSFLTVTGSPVVGAGTLAGAYATGLTSNEDQLVGVNSSGAAGLNAPSVYGLPIVTGVLNTGHCAEWSATSPPTLEDSGASCGGGSGSVTSVSVAGTTSQINTAGTCSSTSVVSCTLSLPSTINVNTSGTSGGLTSYPTLCVGGAFSQGLSAGSNNCATPSGGSSVSVNGSSVSSPNFNASAPSPDAGYTAATYKVSGSSVITEIQLPTLSSLGAANAALSNLSGSPTLCTGGQFSQGVSSGSNNCGNPAGSGTVTSVAAGTGLAASPSPIIGSGTLSLSNPVTEGAIVKTSAYPVVAADLGALIVMNCSSTCAVTLPATPPAVPWAIGVMSIGSTLATVSLNSNNWNGQASPPLLQSFDMLAVYSNGSAYYGVGPYLPGTGLAFTPGATNGSFSTVASTHSCVIDNDTQSATALVAANFSGRCAIPAASTIVEVDVIGGTGVLTGTPAAPTVTGTGSVQIGIYRPAGSSPTDAILSAALATASGKACALPTAGSATCGIMGITQAGSSLSISTTALNKGDFLYVSAATPDAAQTWYTVTIFYQ